MKIALLSGASTIHTIRWANGLAAAGVEVHLISQHPVLEALDPKVKTYIFKYRGVIGYFTMVPKVKKLLKKIKPDLVNAHYASGYATTARLVGYHPWVLSVWGSDVYDFPYKSPLHGKLVQDNLLYADQLASTSICMAQQTQSLIPSRDLDITITPFGVDTKYYDSLTTPLSEKTNDTSIVIGTVKTLAPKYGIDTLINAFALILKSLANTHPNIEKKLKLRIVGDGPQKEELKNLAEQLRIKDRVDFVGRVNSKNVPYELDKFDIYVALSRLDSESFGVAIIEAGAAGRPVVVSDAGGLPEVVIDGTTGFVVPRESPKAAADAITKLVLEKHLRINMGNAGKEHVSSNYDWTKCIDIMIDLYKQTIKTQS
ncbi:glycosyltransferase [Psychrobacter sp. UBA3962]|uniref:glycosyltransferase n=1 Tax=Psychrobacter sp. UBA3962 TaxID=1947352 RepID=UPI0025D13B86|nr:glycosyltransferase [Psychrobacter sp. UBA3962]